MKYTVGTLAKLFGVSTNTIRRYSEMGYIIPRKDKYSKYSYYDIYDVNRIVEVRMYRKFGLSHDEIKKIVKSDVTGIVDSFEKRLDIMENEINKLKALRNMFKANMIMIKRIEEYESGYITQNVEATYYIEYQKEQKLFEEEERLKSIQNFMYCLPETKEVLIFKKNDIMKSKFECSFGVAAKKKDIDEFNIEINKYMTFLPAQKCIYFPIKTYFGGNEVTKINNNIKKEKFENALSYLKNTNYTLNNDILGFNITSFMENNSRFNYTLICLPVSEIR